MRTRTAWFRAALLLASGFMGLRAAEIERFVAPGDTGKIFLSIENVQGSAAPLNGARIELTNSPHFKVGGTSILRAPQIAPGVKYDFIVDYSIPADAPETTFSIGVKPRSETEGLQPGLESADATIIFKIDFTPPALSFIGAAGTRLLNDLGQPVKSGDTIRHKRVTVRADDTGGSGISSVEISGPAPYERTVHAGGSVIDRTFEDLKNGDYIVTVKDRAGNSAEIRFTIAADDVAPTLTVRRPNADIIHNDGFHDGMTVLISAADNVGTGQSGLVEIAIIGLDPHNAFANILEFDNLATVSFSTTLPLGAYWIFAADAEGNFKEQTFELLSTTGAIVSLQVGGDYLYNEFRGISISSPSMVSQNLLGFNAGTGEPIMETVISYRARSFLGATGSQVPGVPINKIEATGPNGFRFVSDVVPSAFDITQTGLPPMSAGTYQVTVTDVQEGKTFMPFKVVDLIPYVCPDASSVFIDSFTFTVDNHICLKSSLGLKSIQQFTRLGEPVGGAVPISGNTLQYISLSTAGPFTEKLFTINDVESNTSGVLSRVSLAYAVLSAESGGAANLTSVPLNLTAAGILPGARFIGGTGGVAVVTEQQIVRNIPISNNAQTIGTLNVQLNGVSIVSGNITLSTMGVMTVPAFAEGDNRPVGQNPVLTASVVGVVPATIFSGNCTEFASPTLCATGTVAVATKLTSVGGTIAGAQAQVFRDIGGSRNVLAGGPEILSLGSGVEIELPEHGAGLLGLIITTKRPPLRYASIPKTTAYRVMSQSVFTGPAKVRLPYAFAGLTAAQQAQLTIVESTRVNPGPEDFLPIPSQFLGGKLVGTTNNLNSQFGTEFMVVAPIHANPCVAGNSDLLIQSDRCDIAVTPESGASFAIRKVLAGLSARGLLPVTDIYHVGPDGTSFPAAAVVEMRIDDARLNALNIAKSSLRIFQFNALGAMVMPSPSSGNGRLAAKVSKLTSNFAIFGNGAPVLVDLSSPRTVLSFKPQAGASSSGMVVIDTRTEISLLASDPVLPNYLTSEVAQTRLLVDAVFTDTAATPGALYTSTFTLSTGTHSLAYYSVDNKGNVEPVSFTTVLVTLPDSQPPRTSFAVGSPSTTVANALYVSGSSPLGFTTADDNQTLNDGLGVGATQTFYAIDGGTYTRYSSTFSLVVEGTRTITVYSVDREGNIETPRRHVLIADLTAPVSQLTQNGAEITLAASDANGAGVARIRYLVDYPNPAVCAGVAESTGAARGTCENPWYAGPFLLPGGDHAVAFQAVDAVGNGEALRTVTVNVSTAVPSAGGMGIGKDPFDALWTVVSDNGAPSLARLNAAGARVAAAGLPDAVVDFPWSVFFDAAGRSYAIGVAEGLSTRAGDVAVYKASAGGDAIEARTLFDSGYANNDIVLDAKAPGWIVGAAQTSGPTDFNAPGARNLALALWKFDPALGTIQLSTSTSRASFDIGAGVAVDPDGSLWISGYSLRPNAPATLGYDLALWHYAADGRTPLGEPVLWPGYLSDFDGSITARIHVSSDALFIAAPRVNAAGGTDTALLRFDKAARRTTAESVWRASNGASSYPVAILPEASGLLIAGGIGSAVTRAALWRFGFDGGFRSAATAQAGGAAGAVFKGSELWLSVDGSTVPYRVLAESPAAGALIDISTPAPRLASLALTPAFASIPAGTTAYFEAAGTFTDGSTRTLTGEVSWTTAYSTVTSVISGAALGRGEGVSAVIASSGAVTARATLTVTPPILVSIAVTPAPASMPKGTTALFDAAGTFTDGSTRTLTVLWSTDVSTVATITPAGVAFAAGQGKAHVIASSGTITGRSLLTVTPPAIVSIAVAPSSATIVGGISTAQFAAGGTFTDGSTRTITGEVFWSTDVSSVAAVSPSGLASGVGAGGARIIASMGAVSGSGRLTVIAPPLSLGSIAPAYGSVNQSVAATLTGMGFDAATALTLERTQPLKETWAATGSFAQARYLSTLTLLRDGRILMAGGSSGANSVGSPFTEFYDPATGAWTSGPPLLQARDQHSAVMLSDGRVLVAGGYCSGAPIKTAEIYDPALNTWTTAAPMSAARSWYQLILLADGRVLAAGGLDNVGYLSGAEIYNPATNAWSAAAPMPQGHGGAATVRLADGKVLVAGGFGGNLAGNVYNPATNAWTAAGGALRASDHFLQAVTRADGKVMIAGDPGGTTDLYDPATNMLTSAGSLVVARYIHAMVRVSGTAMVIGGENSSALSSSEFYDVAAGAWRMGPALATPRTWARAAALEDGRIIVAGGFPTIAGTRLNTVELLGAPPVVIAAAGETASNWTRLTGTLNLTGAATGYWDVVVRRSDGQKDRLNAGFEVLKAPVVLASIAVSPSTASILAGATIQFTAAGTYTDGSTRTLSVAWTTDASSVATVNAAGLALGVGGGRARVIASSGVSSAYATLNVAYVATSPGSVNGSPEVTLVSTAPFSVVAASTATGAGAAALGTATGQGLVLVSPLYQVTREDQGATAALTWLFDPVLVDTATLAIWRFDGISWSSMTVLNQVVSVAGRIGTVTGEVTRTSLFGLFARDITPPVTTARIGAPLFVATDGTNYIAPATPVAFTAVDPTVSGAASGVSRIEVAVDGGSFAAYSSALTFAQGRRTILYRAVDNAANVEAIRRLDLHSDAAPPHTALAVIGGKQASSPLSDTVYASLDTRYALPSTDPVVNAVASGVAFTRYQDNSGAFLTFTAPIALPEGSHLFVYQSQDNVSNLEVPRSTTVLVDATAPVSSATIGSPSFIGFDGTRYITPVTPVTLSAFDPVVTAVASGVDRIEISIDGGVFSAYAFALTFAEGRHTVLFRALDRVGNVSATSRLELQSDRTPPVTAFTPSGALFSAEGRSYAPAQLTYALPAQDPVVSNVASGVAFTNYRTGQAAYLNFVSAFSLSEGIRRVEFQSRDNLGNLELLKSVTVFVDATVPVSALAVGNPKFDPGDGRPVFVAAATPLTLSANDPIVQEVASGVRQVSLRRGADAFAPYVAPFALPLPDGLKTVDYFATDNVGNAEAARSTSVVLDNTAPATALAVLGGRQFPGPNAASFYASSDTRLALPAVDPMVNGVASGLALTQWQDNSGAFQSFFAVFGLAEGSHLLAYQSQDRVLNMEVPRSTTVLVDATAPVSSATIGAPLFVAADGTNYITPATPVRLSAVDPSLPTGQPGSGVSRIEVAIDGGLFAVYSTALTFAEGRHTILYRAIDNVANVETTRTLHVRSDATPPLSSLVVGQPQFQWTNVLLVSTRTPFGVAVVDPVTNNVASGVKDTSLRISDLAPGTGAFSVFTAPFTVSGADVNKVIEFYSRDNVLNTEVVRSSTVLLDSAPPEVALLSPATCDSGICRVLKGRFPVLGTVRDTHFANYQLEFAPGKNAGAGFAHISSGTLAVSSGTLGTWDATALSGWFTVRLNATDLVLNAASVALNVFVGDPGQSFVLGNHDVFNMPEGVAVGADDKIYVADRNNDRVAVFSSTGGLLASFGRRQDQTGEHRGEHRESTTTLRLSNPSGVAVDAAGNIYIADTQNDRVVKLSATGQILLNLGRREQGQEGRHEGQFENHGRLPGQFHHPAGVAVDAAQAIYVADTENRRVQVFSSTGAFRLQFDLPPVPASDDRDDDAGVASRGKPFSVALDDAGNIYVADPKGRRALKFGATGRLLLTIPIAGEPFGVAVSTSGRCLLVSDRKNSRILKFDFLGSQNLEFGTKGRVRDDDAPAPSGVIVLKKPVGLALDAQGSLFVADRNNSRIRKFGLPTGQPTVVVPPSKPGDEHEARDVVDTEDGGKVERKDRAAVEFPAGAVAQDMKVTVSPPASGSADESNRKRAVEGAKLKVVSPPVEFGPEGSQFATAVTLTLPYSPELAALGGVDEKDLKVNYWNREKAQWQELESVVDAKTRTVKAKTTHFSLYQVFSGTVSAAANAPLAADAAFALRDAYAFPNPVRGVNAATIRIQTGLADSVEVRVYDVSGRKIHSSSNFSLSTNLDDGNGKGAQYTYDHAWDVSGVGSGVYQYVITAKKAGQSDIHKVGRIGVVK